MLIDQNKNLKLIDFGFSKQYLKGEKLKECLGTPAFYAPEIIRRLKYDPEKVDVSNFLTSFYNYFSKVIQVLGLVLWNYSLLFLNGKTPICPTK